MPDIPPNLNVPEDLSNIFSELIPGGYTVLDSKVNEDGVLESLEVKPNGVENITYLYEREGSYDKETDKSYPTIMRLSDDGMYAEQVCIYIDGKWTTFRDQEQ